MHLYVHVPFCKRRCSYCDFAIAVRKQVPGDEFVELIKREYALRESPTEPLDTLYFGGGTPSLLSTDQIADLIGFFRSEIGFANPTVEVTLEANPDDVSPETAGAWAAAGVNRCSLGVQSLQPAVLEWMHRTHTAGQALTAIGTLTRAGIASVSADVIFALPEALESDPLGDTEQLLEFELDHVSAYGLTVESGTPVAKWTQRGAVRHVADDVYEEEFLRLRGVLTGAGFEHYEVSNYAKPGRRSRHNSAYWTGAPYVGMGPSAHSFDGETRRWNLRDWAEYSRTVAGGADPLAGQETLSPTERLLEQWYLGLRRAEGVRVPQGGEPVGPALDAAVGAGWLEMEGPVIRPTPHGWLRLDAIITSLTTSAEGG
jgi:oxygen-independent coproporphyrinogen-3 oxidase